MTDDILVFISSRMLELKPEREALYHLFSTLDYGTIQLKAWVFESDAPASNYHIRKVYLDALRKCSLYVGLFWNGYGEWTIDEFDRATEWGIDRHIYVKDVDADKRDVRLTQFLDQQSGVTSGITAKWFKTEDELKAAVEKSIAEWIKERLQYQAGAAQATLMTDPDDVPGLRKLIGQDNLLTDITTLVTDHRQILLQGFGGVGKSALAAFVARNHLKTDNHNVLWLKTGMSSAAAIFDALARAFDMQDELARTAEASRVQTIRKMLRDNGISLLVLDNVWRGESLFEVIRAIPSSTALVVTSRQRYSMDVIREVGNLAPPDAITLLEYHAGQTYGKTAEALCKKLGYLAFAIEIAGRVLKARKLTPDELLKQIEDAPHTLKTPAGFTERERETVKDLLDASLYALDQSVQKVFLSFGVFASAHITPALLGMIEKHPNLEEALLTLQDHGLASRDHDHDNGDIIVYSIHDLANSYARAQATPDQTTAALKACVAYAETFVSDWDKLGVELDNLIDAVNYAYQQGEPKLAIEIMKSLALGEYSVGQGYSAETYLDKRGYTLPLLDALEQSIAAGKTLGADYDEIRHYMLGKLGNIHHQRGTLDKAINAYTESGELAQKLGLTNRHILAMCVTALVRAEMGEITVADQEFDKAYQLAQASSDNELISLVLEKQAHHAFNQKEYDKARQLSMEEVELAKQSDDKIALLFGYLNWAAAELELHNYDVSRQHFEQALEQARAAEVQSWIADALFGLGASYDKLNLRDKAQSTFEEGLSICNHINYVTKANEFKSYMKENNYQLDETIP